jgi:hypothetical protein
MKTLKTKKFASFASKNSISDEMLKAIAAQFADGKIDVNLGGGVYKQRLARPGAGKSGGYRVIIFYKKDNLVIFFDVFAKSSKKNLSRSELQYAVKLADCLLNLTLKQIRALLKSGTLIEVK